MLSDCHDLSPALFRIYSLPPCGFFLNLIFAIFFFFPGGLGTGNKPDGNKFYTSIILMIVHYFSRSCRNFFFFLALIQPSIRSL